MSEKSHLLIMSSESAKASTELTSVSDDEKEHTKNTNTQSEVNSS